MFFIVMSSSVRFAYSASRTVSQVIATATKTRIGTYRELSTKCLVALAITLGDCNGVIIVDVVEEIVGYIPYMA